MTIPARLLTPAVDATRAALTAALESVQAGRDEGRYVQIRRGNVPDRRAAGLPVEFDGFDFWVDEYADPDGDIGWIGTAEALIPAEETASGEAERWRYRHHVGPEPRGGVFGEWFLVDDGGIFG